MLALWCAGQLGNCTSNVKRFRFSCLFCRWRRRYLGKFVDPPYWIQYTFLSRIRQSYGKTFVHKGVEYKAPDGTFFIINKLETVKIDPRGRFTGFRCASIIVFDYIMKMLPRLEKPFAEFSELLANYPV